MIKHLLLVLSVQFSLAISAQHSDVAEFGLKGKVKTVIVYQYELIRQNENGQWETVDTNKYWSKAFRYFSKGGEIDSFTLIHNNNHLKKPFNKIQFFKTTYQSSKKGFREKGLQVYNDSSSTTNSTYSYTWINSRQYKEQAITGDSMVTEVYYTLSKESRDSFTVTKSYSNDSLIQFTEQTKYWDDKGDLSKIVKTNKLKNTTNTTFHQVLEYDKWGNPTIIYIFKEGANRPNSILYRKFEYYK